jgi:hypothetical protein
MNIKISLKLVFESRTGINLTSNSILSSIITTLGPPIVVSELDNNIVSALYGVDESRKSVR